MAMRPMPSFLHSFILSILKAELREETGRSQGERAPGTPIPIFILGFDLVGRTCGMTAVEAILDSGAELGAELGCFLPIMSVHDGLGSLSPEERLPYSMAVQAGLSAASLKMIGSGLKEGRTLRGGGHADPAKVGPDTLLFLSSPICTISSPETTSLALYPCPSIAPPLFPVGAPHLSFSPHGCPGSRHCEPEAQRGPLCLRGQEEAVEAASRHDQGRRDGPVRIAGLCLPPLGNEGISPWLPSSTNWTGHASLSSSMTTVIPLSLL